MNNPAATRSARHLEFQRRWPRRRAGSSSTAHRQAIDLQAGLANAHRNTLSVLAAGADARVEREIVADHADARQLIVPVADQRRAFHGVRDLAVLDQVG